MYVILDALASPPHQGLVRTRPSGALPMSQFARDFATRVLPIALIALLAACGKPPGGGFQGFPPAEVTTIKLEPKTLPATYEYVGQTTGSKEVEVRARVTGILERKLYQEGAPV